MVQFFNLIVSVVCFVMIRFYGFSNGLKLFFLALGLVYAVVAAIAGRRNIALQRIVLAADLIIVLATVIYLNYLVLFEVPRRGRGWLLGLIPMGLAILIPLMIYLPVFRQSYRLVQKKWRRVRPEVEIEVEPGWDEANGGPPPRDGDRA